MKKTLIIAGAVLLSGALALGGTTAASAHTGDLDVVAQCNEQTGQYDFTATLNITQTGLTGSTHWKVGTPSFTGTPSSNAGLDRGPVSSTGAETITLGTFSLPGTTTGLGPWVYAFTTWSDNYTKGSDGQLRKALAGDCQIPVVPPTVVPIAPSIDHLDPCGPDNLIVNVPESTEEVTYTTESVENRVKVTATATEGHTLTLDGETTAESFTWTFEDSNEPCPVETVPPTPTTPPVPPVLAETGPNEDLQVLLLGGGLLILLGLGFWIANNDRWKVG